jgi:hypothetical protein
MARQLKPLKVDTVYLEPYGMQAEVFLDRNSNVFFAKYAGQKVEDATANGCIVKAREMLRKSLDLKWQQVIIISRDTHGFRDSSLDFDAERLELAIAPGSGCIRRPFRTEPDDPEPAKLHPLDEEHIDDPHWGAKWHAHRFPKSDTQQVVLPYSKEAWRTVLAITNAIESTRAKIDELLGSKNIEQRLITGNLQLPALPAHEEEDGGKKRRKR